DRVPSAALALLIVALAVAVCLIWLRPTRRDGRLLPIALVSLMAAGTLATLNPWSNDWVFLSVRGVAQRGGVMPLPTASRVYESSDLGALSGRYVQTLEEITLAPGRRPRTLDRPETRFSWLSTDGPMCSQPVDRRSRS